LITIQGMTFVLIGKLRLRAKILQKSHINELAYENSVRFTTQILVFEFIVKFAASICRIWSICMRAKISLKFEVEMSCNSIVS